LGTAGTEQTFEKLQEMNTMARQNSSIESIQNHFFPVLYYSYTN